MVSKECIVLAGGLGTRLRGVIGEMPKCMAPVGGQPFLYWLFRYLQKEGCTRCILSLGYQHQMVLEWLKKETFPFEVDYVLEQEPLGTGGGLVLALQQCREAHVFVVNGDTLFDASLEGLLKVHSATDAETTLALKPMTDFDRYGTVQTDGKGWITAFEEKQPRSAGWINGGIYVIARGRFLSRNFEDRFSLEKEYLEPVVGQGVLAAAVAEGYFIDIGIPADYERAQTEVPALFR